MERFRFVYTITARGCYYLNVGVYLESVQVPKPVGDVGDCFPFTLPLYRNGLDLVFEKPVTVFAGENASGKSTLLESLAVACGFPRQGGTSANIIRKTYGSDYSGNEVEIEPDNLELAKYMRLTWRTRTRRGYFLRAEYMTDTLAQHSMSDKYLSCSHGEGILEIAGDFFKDGLFILDEPETALSPTSQLALLGLIDRNVKMFNAQYIIVTHSPILMGIPGSDFGWIENGAFSRMSYTECPHFQITKAFCNNPKRFIEQLK